MLKKDIALVVVAYNSGEQLQRCLDSVKISALQAGMSIYLVVVDNHADSLDSWADSECDHYIALPSNPGFGVGNNAGLNYLLAEVDFTRVLLLNPDAWLEGAFMSRLREFLVLDDAADVIAPLSILPTNVRALSISDLLIPNTEARSIMLHTGLSSIVIHSNKGEPLHIGMASFTQVLKDQWLSWPIGGAPTQIRLINADTGEELASHTAAQLENLSLNRSIILNAGSFVEAPSEAGDIAHLFLDTGFYSNSTVEVGGWCGSAVVLSRRYLTDVGGFSPAFFMYYEDSDLSLRGLRAGYLTKFNPELVVYHELSSSTGAVPHLRQQWIVRSRGVFSARGFGLPVSVMKFLLHINREKIARLLRNPNALQRAGGARKMLIKLKGAIAGSISRKKTMLRG